MKEPPGSVNDNDKRKLRSKYYYVTKKSKVICDGVRLGSYTCIDCCLTCTKITTCKHKCNVDTEVMDPEISCGNAKTLGPLEYILHKEIAKGGGLHDTLVRKRKDHENKKA